MEQPLMSVILAAGEGRRMHSSLPKALMPLCGLTLLDWALLALKQAGSDMPALAVVGHGQAQLKAHYGESLKFCEQTVLGTGGALLASLSLLNETGRIFVLASDMPLIKPSTLLALAKPDCDAAFAVTSLLPGDNRSRVVKNEEGALTALADADTVFVSYSPKEVKAAAYCFYAPVLMDALKELSARPGLSELSMSALMNFLLSSGAKLKTVAVEPDEALDVNDRAELAKAGALLRARINTKHMLNGVTLLDPMAAYIDETVKLGRDCTIYPGVVLEGNTVVGEGTTLYPGCRLVNSNIGRFCKAQAVVALDAVVGDNVTLGPFVNLRPGTRLKDFCKVGNYIEVKNSVVGEGSKLPHLSYIGDGDVGKRVNIGCGSVFVNYDGYKKHRTTIGDDVFIGCNSSLVAPVSVGSRSYTAAGSVITEDVPEDTLAIARAKQVNKVGYVAKLRSKRSGDKA